MRAGQVAHAMMVVGLGAMTACGGAQSRSDAFTAHLERACGDADTVDKCRDYLNRLTAYSMSCQRGLRADGCQTIDARMRVARARYEEIEAAHDSAASATAAPASPSAGTPSTALTPASEPSSVDGGATAGPPTQEDVGNAIRLATPKALEACGLAGSPVLVEIELDVKTTGQVATVTLQDSLRYGAGGFMAGGTVVPAVATMAVRNCLTSAYRGLTFSSFTLPASKGGAYRCPPGAAVFNPERFCTRVIQDTQTYDVAVLLDGSGNVSNPSAEQARQFFASVSNAAKSAACASTKASGFPTGTYAGEASQHLNLRDGSKVFAWKSLTITVDENGCLTWRGLSFEDGSMPGDEARNIEKVTATCINEGDGAIAGAGSTFKLTATVRGKGSGGTPTRFHIWKCPGIGNVRTDMAADLSSSGCVQIGNAADPTAEALADVGCQMSKDFDELKDRTMTVQKDGSVRVPLTIADPGTLVLRRVDKRQ
jgi:hypothetical protein